MSKEEKLRKAAIAVTGDDSIDEVAELVPKGAAEASAAGLVAGAAVGGAVTGGDSGVRVPVLSAAGLPPELRWGSLGISRHGSVLPYHRTRSIC